MTLEQGYRRKPEKSTVSREQSRHESGQSGMGPEKGKA